MQFLGYNEKTLKIRFFGRAGAEMAKEKKKWWWILGVWAFILYIFISARSISEETILRPRWVTSLESSYPGGDPVSLGDFLPRDGERPIPFLLGERFGYVRDDGKFAINQIRRGYISLSENTWAEYDALPSSISIMNPQNETVLDIPEASGYPLLIDDRVFLVGNEQNSLTALGPDGEELWTHDFPAPLTCVDAAGGFVLAGTLDGVIELLNSSGTLVFAPFEPGGSRLSVILGCAISRDASHLAVVSGIDDQRFLLLERAGVESRTAAARWSDQTGVSGDTYKVVYHEFLPGGFRRPVHISFADNDGKVLFEKEGGLGIYDINSRGSISINLEGEIAALDGSGENGFLFVVTSQGPKQKRLIVIRYPAFIVNQAPFKSDSAFFARRGGTIYLAGDAAMASFELEKN